MNPRYSIIPGDFAEDLRADEGHFRVLNLLGRHTDAAGWCRLKQTRIGEAIGLTRETVNRKLRDLVEWGYVEKRADDATGRAIYYRTIMDRPTPPPAIAPDDPGDDESRETDAAHASGMTGGPVNDGSHVGCNSGETCEAGVTPGVSAEDHTRCDRIESQQERPFLNDQVKNPPNPPVGGTSAKPGDGQWKAGALATLRANAKHADAVEHLIAPLLASDKRLSLGTDKLAALREVAEAAAGIPTEALQAAVKRLCDQSQKLTVVLIRKEVDLARKYGAMVVIRRGTPQWARWHEHERTENPAHARFMDTHDATQVPSQWPPAKSSGRAA